MDTPTLIQKIQYAIAPAVMVSSSALLLLGFQNKFSSLANRFRALNHEKRLLSQNPGRGQQENERYKSLTEQTDELMRRARYIKNAILLTYLGILCFTVTSIVIFFESYLIFTWIRITVSVFALGLLFLWVSAILMILETNLFYKIIKLEYKA